MDARTVFRGAVFVLEAVLVALAIGVVGLMAGDIAVETGVVDCDELECLEPPLKGALIGTAVGAVAGACIVVRSRGRRLFPNVGWVVIAGAGVLFVPYVLYSRTV